ncbi:MAG: alpha/beta fold hydrolase [Pseudomonadota bacterium]
MEHHYADINGTRLHYVSAGARGPLILFVHGFPEFWYAWKAQLEDFSRDHQAVALDMRGYNLSDKPADVKAYRAKHLVQDLRGLIDHLGGRPCVLVAHDWGGAVAWNFAVEYPEYLSRLVIINAPHPVLFSRALRTSPEQAAASQYMVLLRSQKAERVLAENDYARLVRMLRSEGGAGRAWLGDDDLELYREAWARPGALTGGLNYYRASPLYPASPDDPQYEPPHLDPAAFTVSVPTLVIWGERDRALRPVLLEGMGEVVRKLTVKRIPEGSHWVAHEYPDLVNRHIREFISN